MPEIVNIDGSEEDFGRLLVRHKIVSQAQLQAAIDSRRKRGAAAGIDTLRAELQQSRTVASPQIFDEFRTASRVRLSCTKCDAEHDIYYYDAASRYYCSACKGTLRVVDPGESLTWKPTKPAIARPPEEVSAFPLGVGGETMLDMGSLAKAAASPPLPAARAAEPTDPAFPLGVGGETMLDMGNVGKASAPGPVPPEEALAPRAAAGDAAACEAIYHAYKGLAWQVASGSLGDHQDSEEALQETFRRLFRSLDKFDPRAGRLKAYVAAITRNVCKDLLRSRAKQLGRGVLEELTEAIVDEAEKAQDPDRVEEILKAAGACLDKRSREIVDWKVKGLRNKEIASKLNLDAGTVSSYLTRSVRAIREHLKKTQHLPDRNGSGKGH